MFWVSRIVDSDLYLVIQSERFAAERGEEDVEADRMISTSKLHMLPHFHTWPINVVVFHGSQRDLVLRGASRLDAFSGYPFRT